MKRLLLALAVSCSLAACGGEDRLSTEDYRSKARSICQEADRATKAVEQPQRTTNDAIANYFERLMTVNRKTTDEFAGLEPPEDLEKQHEAALDANRAGVDEVQKLVDELKRGGDARALLQSAQGRLEQLSDRSARAARALGVPECARQ